MSTASDARAPSPENLNASRRRRSLLWLVLTIAAAVVAGVFVKQRWDVSREEAISHDRTAREYARSGANQRERAEAYAREAEALEKSAQGFDHDFLLGPLLVAEEHRRDEADTRAQEAYYSKKADEEKRLAEDARKRW